MGLSVDSLELRKKDFAEIKTSILYHAFKRISVALSKNKSSIEHILMVFKYPLFFTTVPASSTVPPSPIVPLLWVWSPPTVPLSSIVPPPPFPQCYDFHRAVCTRAQFIQNDAITMSNIHKHDLYKNKIYTRTRFVQEYNLCTNTICTKIKFHAPFSAALNTST